VEAKEEMY